MNVRFPRSLRRALALPFLGAAAFLPLLSAPLAHAANPAIFVTATVTVPSAPAAVTGSGFGSGETVFLTFGKQSTEVVADAGGSFSTSLAIPNVPSGLQFVSAWGESSGTWSLAYLWIAGFSPQVSPNSYYLLPGGALSFLGTGFAPNETVTASYGGNTLATYTADSAGSFSGPAASLPLPLANTTATVEFAGATSHASASVTLTIGQLYPNIAPSTWYTSAGSDISLSGSGFAPNEDIGVSAGAQTASTTADASGAWSLDSFALPPSGGVLSITATGAGSGASATANIFLTTPSPWLTFSTYWAQGGSPLTIFGNAFLPHESVTLSSSRGVIGTTSADVGGNFSFPTFVPFAPAGTLTITGLGAGSGASASAPLTLAPVYTDLQLVSYAGAPGESVEFIGHGYLPNEPIEITTDRTGSTVVAAFAANGSGDFSGSFAVPAAFAPGPLTLTATGTHSFDAKSIIYYITGG